jgi:hypothetical protein
MAIGTSIFFVRIKKEKGIYIILFFLKKKSPKFPPKHLEFRI